MKNHTRILLVSCSALMAAAAAAQEPAPAPGDNYTPAAPILRVAPKYPEAALRRGREGWAKVSFIITENGSILEPMIEDSSHPDFDEPTLRAIETWRFKPATQDGKPVEQSMVQTLIRYQIEGGGGDIGRAGATAKFVEK